MLWHPEHHPYNCLAFPLNLRAILLADTFSIGIIFISPPLENI